MLESSSSKGLFCCRANLLRGFIRKSDGRATSPMKQMAKNATDVRRRKILLSELDMAFADVAVEKVLSVVWEEEG